MNRYASSRPMYAANIGLSVLNFGLWLWNAGAPGVATFWVLVAFASVWAYAKDL